ncbi:hypothetical protein ABEX38_30045 [Priestia megaterium]
MVITVKGHMSQNERNFFAGTRHGAEVLAVVDELLNEGYTGEIRIHGHDDESAFVTFDKGIFIIKENSAIRLIHSELKTINALYANMK